MSVEKSEAPNTTLDDLEAPVIDLTEEEAKAVAGGLLPAHGTFVAGDGSVMPADPENLNFQKVKNLSSP